MTKDIKGGRVEFETKRTYKLTPIGDISFVFFSKSRRKGKRILVSDIKTIWASRMDIDKKTEKALIKSMKEKGSDLLSDGNHFYTTMGGVIVEIEHPQFKKELEHDKEIYGDEFGLGGTLVSAGIGAYLGAKNPSSVQKVTDPIDKAVSDIASNFTDDKSYEKGGEVESMYEVEYWETEEDRDTGEGQMYMLSEEEEISKEKSIERAKNLFSKQNFAAVEVLDEDGSAIFFISNDTPKGESYAKGGMTDAPSNKIGEVKFSIAKGSDFDIEVPEGKFRLLRAKPFEIPVEIISISENPNERPFNKMSVNDSPIAKKYQKEIQEFYNDDMSRFAKGGKTIGREEVVAVLKDELEEVMEDVGDEYEVNEVNGEELEHESRDGFIAYTDGGYQYNFITYSKYLTGSGKSLPTKVLDDKIEEFNERGIEYAQEEIWNDNSDEKFREKFPSKEDVNYADLDEYEEGLGEEFDEKVNDYNDDDSIYFLLEAMYYSPENDKGEDGKHTIALSGSVNLESPYHRRGFLEDYKEIIFTFSSIKDLKEKLEKNLKTIKEWFEFSDYKTSTTEIKVGRFEKGGSIGDISGNYFSSTDFVKSNNLMPLAKKTFGEDWESGGDYDYDNVEIEMLVKRLGGGYKVVYVDSDRQNRDNFEAAKQKYFPKMDYNSNDGVLFVVRTRDASTYKQGGDIDGDNGYIAFYKGKKMEVYADSSLHARDKAAKLFKAKKSYDVRVVLAEKDGKQVIHNAYFSEGGKISVYDERNIRQGKKKISIVMLENEKGVVKSVMFADDIQKQYNRNKQEDIDKLWELSNKVPYMTIIDKNYKFEKGGEVDYGNRTTKDFKLGELVYDTSNKRYGTIIGIYDEEGYEVRLDSDGMQPTEFLRKLGEKGDVGTKKQLFEGVASIERLIRVYPENNYPEIINNPFYKKGGYVVKGRTNNETFFATREDMPFTSKAEAEKSTKELNAMLKSKTKSLGKSTQEHLKEQYRLNDNIEEFYTEKSYEKGVGLGFVNLDRGFTTDFPSGKYELIREIKGTKVVPEGSYQIKNLEGKKIVLAKSRFSYLYAKGGEISTKGNEMLIGGLFGIALGIFLNK